MALGSCQHRCLFTLLSAFILAWLVGAGGVIADPDPAVIQDQSTTTTGSSSSSSAAAAAAAAAAASSGSGVAPPPVVPPPPGGPIVPPMLPGAGAGAGINFEKHLSFSKGFGSLLGLLPGGLGLGGGGLPPPVGGIGEPPIGGELPPPIDGLGGAGGYLGMPWFLGPQYIPATWWGSALAAKGDLLFPIAIFLFAVVGVIIVIKFLLALLVPFLAKKWAIAEAFTHKARRSTADEPGAVPQDVTKAHHAHVDELTHKVLPATSEHDHHNRFANSDSDHDDEDDEFDG